MAAGKGGRVCRLARVFPALQVSQASAVTHALVDGARGWPDRGDVRSSALGRRVTRPTLIMADPPNVAAETPEARVNDPSALHPSTQAEPGARRPRRLERVRLVVAMVLGALIALFAVLNVDPVVVNWGFGSWSTPLIAVIAVSATIGAALDRLTVHRSRRRKNRSL